jgi:ADP-ribose pyrophosphatase
MQNEPIGELNQKLVWNGKIYKIYERPVRMPDGRIEVFEVLEAPSVVRIYAIQSGQVALTSEYRPLQGRRVLRVPAGRIEQGEEPLAAAKRELAEETGITATRWQEFGRSKPVVKIEHYVYHFLATELKFGASDLEPGEDITVELTSISEIPRMVYSGMVEEEIVALRLLQLHEQMVNGFTVA